MACFLVLALIALLCMGCGDDKGDGKVTVVIGEITDLTGPASPAIIPLHYVTQDVFRHYNEGGLIPGVELKLATYDQQFNPARDIPGWDWVRDRGAQVVQVVLAPTSEALKFRAEKDKVPIFSQSNTIPMIEPPGWVFTTAPSTSAQLRTILKWISEKHWDYTAEGRVPRIGHLAWRETMGIEQQDAVREYCLANPNEFEWVGGFLPPVASMSFAGEIEALKDCDYISVHAYAAAYFFRDFRARGYDATFFHEASAPAYRGFYVDMIGWEGLDGSITVTTDYWWDETNPIVDLAKELLDRYRPDQAEEMIYAGSTYVGAVSNQTAFCEIMRQAIEEGGVENFDGQAFYNAAAKFEIQMEGYPKRFFTETKRDLVDHVRVYEWSAEAEELVRVSEWLPLITG